MKARIKRFHKDMPLPERKTKGAAAFDLHAREDVLIAPGEIGYVPLNIAVETPDGHFLLLAARSSTHKKGLIMANGIGIVDPDYCGDEDEITAAYLNFLTEPVMVEKGERIAQGMFVQFSVAEWEEVEKHDKKSRGGFGSTGSK
ncbi:MAG: dUTP diphosphatase [Patescibacteria group bacterium]